MFGASLRTIEHFGLAAANSMTPGRNQPSDIPDLREKTTSEAIPGRNQLVDARREGLPPRA